MKQFSVVGALVLFNAYGTSNAMMRAGMPALVSALPEDESQIDPESLQCRDLREGQTRSDNERLGCWILANSNEFFGTPEIGTDLSAALPKVSNVLYDRQGMFNAVREGCFNLVSANGQVERNKYSYSTVEGYKANVESSTSIDISGKGKYLLSTVSASYTSSQDTERKVNNKFSYAKAHVRSELQIGKVYNSCMENSMQKHISSSSRELWEALKANPDDEYILRAFNAHFRTLQTDSWTLGGIYSYDMKTTILENSELDSVAMAKGMEAAASVKFGSFGVDVSTKMSEAFDRETENTKMTTKSEFFDAGISPCPEMAILLRDNITDKDTINRYMIKINDAFQDNFETWTPYKSVGYTSTLDMLLTAEDRERFPNLETKLGQALHDENVRCNPVRMRGFRLIRNKTEGEDETLTLNCAKPDPSSRNEALCRFERGVSTPVVLERTSGDYGMYKQHAYLIHYVGEKDYVQGEAQALLTICKGAGHIGQLCAVEYDPVLNSLGTMSNGTFGYNQESNAFTYTGYDQSQFVAARKKEPVARNLNLRRKGGHTQNPVTNIWGYHYFLDRDSQFIGTDTSDPNVPALGNQHTYLVHVNGIRSSLDGSDTVLCDNEDLQ
mmetsp:Transcript_5539/g.9888  ORF Transcript_5539/g.9888 Transcript_5539/m.9888 type:complete len:613 (-) Transcript_5539:14-1852(-)